MWNIKVNDKRIDKPDTMPILQVSGNSSNLLLFCVFCFTCSFSALFTLMSSEHPKLTTALPSKL